MLRKPTLPLPEFWHSGTACCACQSPRCRLITYAFVGFLFLPIGRAALAQNSPAITEKILLGETKEIFSLQWSLSFSEVGIRNCDHLLTTATGVIVILGDGDQIVAVDATSGSLIWRKQLAYDLNILPVSGAGTVVIPLSSGQLAAIESSGGATIWQIHPGAGIRSLAATQSHLFVETTAPGVVAHSMLDGSVEWAVAIADRLERPFSIDANVLLVPTKNSIRARNAVFDTPARVHV